MVSATLHRTRRPKKKSPARTRGAGATAKNGKTNSLTRLAGEIWEAMFRAVMGRKEQMAAVAAKFELTLAQAHLLRLLQFGPARTMTSLADALACDASNVTGMVDRLESRGLIHRGNAKHDRRIKTITLTGRGSAVVGRLTAGFLEPPDELRRLSETHLKRLHELLLGAFVHAPGQLRSRVRTPSRGPHP